MRGGRDNDEIRPAEFGQDLQAGPARHWRNLPALLRQALWLTAGFGFAGCFTGDDRQRRKMAIPRRNGRARGRAFRADRQAIRRIFHVAALEYAPFLSQKGRANAKLGIRRVSPPYCRDGLF